jgi:hypothetical protein
VIAGAFAGLISRSVNHLFTDTGVLLTFFASFCIAPLDVLKIRLQLQVHSVAGIEFQTKSAKPLQPGTIGTFQSILREEGVRVSFWLRKHCLGSCVANLLFV